MIKKIIKIIFFLFFFPFVLTYLIIRKNNWSPILKTILIFLLWFLFIALTPGEKFQNKSYKSTNSTKKTPLKPSLTPKPSLIPTSKLTLIPTSTPTPKPKNEIKLIRVIDGDTIEVNINGINEKVRFIGVDTPEMNDNRAPIRCFAQEAKNFTERFLRQFNFTLESDPTQSNRDKYNRLLRYVILEDGSNLSKIIIENGYGYEYTYQIPYKYQKEFKEAQKQAEKNELGLWSSNHKCNQIIPTTTPISQTQSNTNNTPNNSSFVCGTKRYCTQMVSCEEAYFYLTNCGLIRLDRDGDGVPCENLCN